MSLIFESMAHWIDRYIVDPFVSALDFAGHGRALEMFLVGLKILIFAQLIPFNPVIVWPTNIPAFADFGVPDSIIASPFILVAFLQAWGLWLNKRGYEISWIIRATGAMIALVMWSWIIIKTMLVGVATPFLLPVATMCFLASIFILWKAMNRLPIPGMPGLR